MRYFTGGDWFVLFLQTIRQLPWWPEVWSNYNGNGFGQNVSFAVGFRVFFAFLSKTFTEIFHFPWNITEQLIFFIPFWVLVLLSSYFLSRYFFKNKLLNLLSSLLYASNTYALMLVGGGQMGVALAYAFSPFVLLAFLKLFEKGRFKTGITTSLLLGLLLCMDPRIAGIILFIVLIFLVFSFSVRKFLSFCLVCFVAILLNIFWILPFLYSGTSGLSDAYTGTNIVSFLSFATFENTISLLHPNWPDNVFGKIGFMRWEFVALAILAYSSLLFLKKPRNNSEQRRILILVLAGLIGAFLGKGINLPFGGVYYFLSNYVPGFIIFRDPTKWYGMVAISYSILIPFTLVSFTIKKIKIQKLKFKITGKKSKLIGRIAIVLFVIYWCISIRQLFLGQLTGTFQPKTIPSEYVKLELLFAREKDFSRILWVPQQSRFGFFTNTHPAVDTFDLITSHDLKPTFQYLKKDSTQVFVEDSVIQYVVVPYDSTGEIFLTDRKYNEKLHQQFISDMKKIPWLVQDNSFKKIGIFTVKNTFPFSYILGENKQISLHQISLTNYKGVVSQQKKPQRIIFSQTFDKHWVLSYGENKIVSKPYKKFFNSFEIPPGVSNFTIEYTTQKWADWGSYISLAVLGVLIVGLVRSKKA